MCITLHKLGQGNMNFKFNFNFYQQPSYLVFWCQKELLEVKNLTCLFFFTFVIVNYKVRAKYIVYKFIRTRNPIKKNRGTNITAKHKCMSTKDDVFVYDIEDNYFCCYFRQIKDFLFFFLVDITADLGRDDAKTKLRDPTKFAMSFLYV